MRNRNVPVILTQKRQYLQKDAPSKETTPAGQNKDKDIVILNQDRTNEASTSNVRKDKELKNESHRKEPQAKGQTKRKDITSKEVEKQSNLFSLENEIPKLKITIPLTELVRNDNYKF